MARAMADAIEFLTTKVSPNRQDWRWGKIHTNEYPHVPFSFIFLKPFYHREVHTGGNVNTVKVSRYSLRRVLEQGVFKSTASANFKMVVQFSNDPEQDVTYMSHEGG